MKSGKKICGRLLEKCGSQNDIHRRVHSLRNGELRSLLLHLTADMKSSEKTYTTAFSEAVLSAAMCEVTRRFLEKGRKVL